MFTLPISAQHLLESPNIHLFFDEKHDSKPYFRKELLTEQDIKNYFASGGTLRSVNQRVKDIIRSGTFFHVHEFDLKSCVRDRLRMCLIYYNERKKEDDVITYLWKNFTSYFDRPLDYQEGLELWTLLAETTINPFHPLVVISSEQTFSQTVECVTKAIKQENYKNDYQYRSQLRMRLYKAVFVRWNKLHESFYAWCLTLKSVLNQAESGFSDLNQAFILLHKIDRDCEKFQPYISTIPANASRNYKTRMIDLTNAAWVTDSLLKDFIANNPLVEKICIKGCFQITSHGIADAEEIAKHLNRPHALTVSTEFTEEDLKYLKLTPECKSGAGSANSTPLLGHSFNEEEIEVLSKEESLFMLDASVETDLNR
jgi:hypothetical protein